MKKYLFIVIPIIILLIVLVFFIWIVPNKKIDDSAFTEEINKIPEINNDIINELEDENITSSKETTNTVETTEANSQKEEIVEDNTSKQVTPPSSPKKSSSNKSESTKKVESKVETKTESKVESKKENTVEKPKDNTTQNKQTTSTPTQNSSSSTSTETKSDEVKKEEPVVRCTTANNHGMGVGNTGKWFTTKEEAIAYYKSQLEYWDAYWQAADPDDAEADATYYKNCPSGYEYWSCPFCSKWTINFYYR